MKNLLKLLILVTIISATAIAFARVKIGFSQMEYNNPWRIAETNSIKEAAAKRGYGLIYTDAKGQVSKQIEDVKYLISQKVNVLILAPREFEGLAPALQIAKKAKVPVILIDREAQGVPGVDYLTLIASDFIWEGEQAAIWLAKASKGQANIVELTGTPGSSVARDRSLGFQRVLQRYPGMKIIASKSGDFARIPGQKAMEEIIQATKEPISAVFAHNDEMAIGAIQALKAAGITPGKDVVLVSCDGERDALKAIIAGELGATVECSPFFGPKVFDVIERYLSGAQIPPRIIVEDRFFDISNAKEFIDKAY